MNCSTISHSVACSQARGGQPRRSTPSKPISKPSQCVKSDVQKNSPPTIRSMAHVKLPTHSHSTPTAHSVDDRLRGRRNSRPKAISKLAIVQAHKTSCAVPRSTWLPPWMTKLSKAKTPSETVDAARIDHQSTEKILSASSNTCRPPFRKSGPSNRAARRVRTRPADAARTGKVGAWAVHRIGSSPCRLRHREGSAAADCAARHRARRCVGRDYGAGAVARHCIGRDYGFGAGSNHLVPPSHGIVPCTRIGEIGLHLAALSSLCTDNRHSFVDVQWDGRCWFLFRFGSRPLLGGCEREAGRVPSSRSPIPFSFLFAEIPARLPPASSFATGRGGFLFRNFSFQGLRHGILQSASVLSEGAVRQHRLRTGM